MKSRLVALLGWLAAGAFVSSAAHAQVPGIEAAAPQDRAALQQLIDGAKQEGSLSYWDTVLQPDTNDVLVAAFLKYYGLPGSFKVNYNYATSLNMVTRVEQELGANRITMDVASVGNPPWAFEKAAAGEFLEYDAPEYRHYTRMFDTGLARKGYFAFNGAYAFVPMWNADLFEFKGRSWRDIAGAGPPGRLGWSNVGSSAAWLTTYYALRGFLDVDYFRKIAVMKPFLAESSQQVAQRLLTGQDLLNFGGQAARAFQSNQKGASLKILYPDEGIVLLPQETFILKTPPHPNAAKLWVNFILSEPGQAIMTQREAMISGRAGFKSPLPQYSPDLDHLKVIDVDWRKIKADDLKKYRDEWVGIFSP
jgi:iron(III) transport system substrate-binding protein